MPTIDTLISEQEVHDAVTRLADALNAHYGERHVTIVGIATGCIVFLSDLIRQLRMPVHIELIRARSYRGDATTRGRLALDLWGLGEEEIAGRNILVLDDIFDTGHTITKVVEAMRSLGASDVRTVALLEKPARREVPMRPDFAAIEIPDEFVVGYGLDHDGRHRNLPYIGVVRQS